MDGDGLGGGPARPEDGTPLATPVPARWPLGGLILVVIAAFAAAVIASLPVIVGLGVGRETAQQRSPADLLLLAGLSDGAMLLAIFGLGRPLLHLTMRDLGLLRPSGAALARAAQVAGLLWLVSIAVNAVQTRVLGANPQSLVVSLGAHSGPAAFAVDLVTSAAIAPFAEEILFRGLIFGGLAQRMPVALAAAISALLWALAHGVGVLLPIFVLGLGLAWVYWRTRSLWAAMLTHALVNAVSLTLLFALPKDLLAG
ncbi:MAG: CPBP family intramembrane metalloprotease [Chloroflexi bacterium]|nr:CPBP family intramembrane metalloprotease [Chloroflexota bacterium]